MSRRSAADGRGTTIASAEVANDGEAAKGGWCDVENVSSPGGERDAGSGA